MGAHRRRAPVRPHPGRRLTLIATVGITCITVAATVPACDNEGRAPGSSARLPVASAESPAPSSRPHSLPTTRCGAVDASWAGGLRA
jgi:hypothetical protein